MKVDDDGGLQLDTAGGEIYQERPLAYQEIEGERRIVECEYKLLPQRRVAFRLGAYRRDLPLVIDPILGLSTYFGGAGNDYINGVDIDASGNIFIAGSTTSTEWPVSGNAVQPLLAGQSDAFVTKLAADGKTVLYSTFLGGPGIDRANGISLDSAGNPHIAGYSMSGLPTTANAHRQECCGAFITKIDSSGASLVYSTYLGSGGEAYAVDVDSVYGYAYVAGISYGDVLVTSGAYDTSYAGNGDAFVAKLSPSGSWLAYSTLIGGNALDYANSVSVDPGGNAYVAGTTHSSDFPTVSTVLDSTFDGDSDAFALMLTAGGSSLSYSTFIGGSGSDSGLSIVRGGDYRVYLSGTTNSVDFPVSSSAYVKGPCTAVACGYVFSMTLNLRYRNYATLLGEVDFYSRYLPLAVDAAGYATVTGTTGSEDLRVSYNAFQTSFGGYRDAFVTRIVPWGSYFDYCSYLGGSGADYGHAIALDASGSAYVAGWTQSANLPVTAGAGQTDLSFGVDGFLARIDAGSSSCYGSLTAPGATVAAAGGTFSANYNTPSHCVWTARTGDSWISLNPPASGLGDGSVSFTVEANTTQLNRIGAVLVNGQSYVITQLGTSSAPTKPNPPGGPDTVIAGEQATFTGSGSTVPAGGDVEYRFSWGDSRYSGWSALPQQVTWSTPGQYDVKTQARSTVSFSNVSVWSDARTVTVLSAGGVLTDSQFASQIYLDTLNRSGSQAGRDYYEGLLVSGGWKRAEVAAEFLRSVEHGRHGDFLVRAYLGSLDRAPSYAEWLDDWTGMKLGDSQLDVVTALTGDADFVTRYGSLDNTSFVTLLYSDALGRQPDPIALEYWTGQLDSGGLSRAGVVLGLINTREYIERVLERVYAHSLFLTLYRRHPSGTELNYWWDYIKNNSLTEAAEQFLNSTEYRGRFQ